MAKIALAFNEINCSGCHACEVACKQEHGLGVGPRLVRVLERTPFFKPLYCHHCDDAPCIIACPEGAISRNEWGIVQVTDELCIGCKACVEACPFGAMQYDEEREGALMCDLCYDRLKNDEAPACSLVCPTGCILWGDTQEISEEIEQKLL